MWQLHSIFFIFFILFILIDALTKRYLICCKYYRDKTGTPLEEVSITEAWSVINLARGEGYWQSYIFKKQGINKIFTYMSYVLFAIFVDTFLNLSFHSYGFTYITIVYQITTEIESIFENLKDAGSTAGSFFFNLIQEIKKRLTFANMERKRGK